MTEVVITGIGVVTPIGIGVEDFWSALLAGRSGAGEIKAFDADDLPVRIACEAKDFEAARFMDPRQAARTDRFTQMAVGAASLALEDAGIDPEGTDDATRAGVIVGSGIGGLSTIEREHKRFLDGGHRRVSPFMVPQLMPNGAAAAIAMRWGLLGVNYAPTSACATGAHAIGEAARTIQNGDCDVMLAGGSEAGITPLSVAAFARMGALSHRNDEPERASRPFDAERNGFVMGEGAGVLILESREHAEARGARVLATLTGYGASADAYHVTQPDPEGNGATLAMRRALEDAGIDADRLDYINAHGTSTPYNDRVETIAIKRALGPESKRIPVSSTKSMTGHLLGAAGAIEAGVCALAVNQDVMPPTINLENPDPDCDLDYVPEGAREGTIRYALSNSFGFGGQNACLVIGKP